MNRRAFFQRCLAAGVLGTPLLEAACGSSPPPRIFAPLRYDYLLPLRLNVASIRILDAFQPGPDDLGRRSPAVPVAALRQMANDRLQADGTGAEAVFTIQDASILRDDSGALRGHMAVRLEILLNGAKVAFTEAKVSRRLNTTDPLRSALYDLTKQMMDDMNVEFELQLRRSLGEWLLSAGDATAPVRSDAL